MIEVYLGDEDGSLNLTTNVIRVSFLPRVGEVIRLQEDQIVVRVDKIEWFVGTNKNYAITTLKVVKA